MHRCTLNFKLLLRFILLIISLAAANTVTWSQIPQGDLNTIDFAKIKVDEISDEQIRLMMEKAAENGVTQQQIEMVALSRGMSQVEVQKLRLRMNTVQMLGGTRIGQRGATTGLMREDVTSQKRTDLKPEDILTSMFAEQIDSLNQKPDPRLKIFGYSLFNTQNLTFEPSVNFPTPANYVLGPGDEISIDIWGASQQNYRLMVSPDGYIIIENVGPVQVNGLTIEKASERIIGRLSSIYAGLSGSNPNTFAQVSLGMLRSIKVVLLGEVYLPGSYVLSSMARAFNALYLSGGPDINGSLRNIEIIRDNKIIDSIDVYDFLFRGDIQKNILLQDQDIIKINPFSIRVIASGEVKRPLIYEMKSGESLADLIRYAGGFSGKAYTNRIKIIRNTSREKEILDVLSSEFVNIPLHNGDSIIIGPILERFANRVEIKGAVYRPGEFAIQDSLSLLQLIGKAEGLKGDAFLSRAVIFRTKENYNLETIPVDLTSLMNGTGNDIMLKREDIVNIPSIFDLQEEYYVQIDGDVRNPGQYPYMYNSTVEDIIIQAGGLLESASMARLEIARRVRDTEAVTTTNKVADIFYYQISKDLRLAEDGKNLTLEPFDRIFIRRSPGYEEQITAFIEGEVLFPGEYSISNKDERISDIIRRSGGLTQDAYPRGASLIRAFKTDEKERTKALQSGELLRRDYIGQTGMITNDPMNSMNNTNILNERKLEVLDSLITSATEFKNEQAIGIDLEMILADPHGKYDIIIQEGDRLVVPKLLQTVSLSGELLHPITARYDKRNGFLDYVRSAGGFTSEASKSRSYVIYANGSVDITRSVFGFKNYPRIEPGAEIVVPVKQEVRRMTPGQLVSLGSALTSMALLLVTLMNSL
jgi:protein involved in polysaccharide export with SLBB domain